MRISVVVPVFNEAAIVPAALKEIFSATASLPEMVDVILVDDGSGDDLKAAVAPFLGNHRITVLTLSRNFGKEAALTAGLFFAKGDAVVTMDGDLQHPPDLIPAFVEEWRKGAKIVHGIHRQRSHQTLSQRIFSNLFYKLFHFLSGMDLKGHSDFKLLDRTAVLALRRMPERSRFFRGMSNWIGLPSASVFFDANARHGSTTKWSFFSLCRYAGRNLVAFSDKPLQAVALLGVLLLLASAGLSVQTVWNFLSGRAMSGFTTVILLQLLLSGFIILSLGLVGVYLGQVLRETKRRPHVVIADVWPQPEPDSQGAADAPP